MSRFSWLADNWFTILQSLGIIGSLLFTGISLRISSKARRVSNLLEITAHHREIWTALYDDPQLSRVLDPSADLKKQPITRKEELLVKFLVLHFASAFRAMKNRMVSEPKGLRADVRTFFALPIPR